MDLEGTVASSQVHHGLGGVGAIPMEKSIDLSMAQSAVLAYATF